MKLILNWISLALLLSFCTARSLLFIKTKKKKNIRKVKFDKTKAVNTSAVRSGLDKLNNLYTSDGDNYINDTQ